jgi:membrane protein DedA with SNARE-associated domain
VSLRRWPESKVQVESHSFAYDSLGSLLWSALYAGLGYVFANNIAAIAASMAKSGNVLAVAIGVPLACYVCWRAWVMAHAASPAPTKDSALASP